MLVSTHTASHLGCWLENNLSSLPSTLHFAGVWMSSTPRAGPLAYHLCAIHLSAHPVERQGAFFYPYVIVVHIGHGTVLLVHSFQCFPSSVMVDGRFRLDSTCCINRNILYMLEAYSTQLPGTYLLGCLHLRVVAVWNQEWFFWLRCLSPKSIYATWSVWELTTINELLPCNTSSFNTPPCLVKRLCASIRW